MKGTLFSFFWAPFWKVFLTFKGNAQWKIQHTNCTVCFRTFTVMFSEGKFYKAVPLILSITQVWLIICYYSCCYYLPRPIYIPIYITPPYSFSAFLFPLFQYLHLWLISLTKTEWDPGNFQGTNHSTEGNWKRSKIWHNENIYLAVLSYR